MTQPDRLREALRTPRRCILCNWNGDIGAFAHMTVILFLSLEGIH